MYNQYFYGLGSAKSCIRELFEYGLQQAAVVGKKTFLTSLWAIPVFLLLHL